MPPRPPLDPPLRKSILTNMAWVSKCMSRKVKDWAGYMTGSLWWQGSRVGDIVNNLER